MTWLNHHAATVAHGGPPASNRLHAGQRSQRLAAQARPAWLPIFAVNAAPPIAGPSEKWVASYGPSLAAT